MKLFIFSGPWLCVPQDWSRQLIMPPPYLRKIKNPRKSTIKAYNTLTGKYKRLPVLPKEPKDLRNPAKNKRQDHVPDDVNILPEQHFHPELPDGAQQPSTSGTAYYWYQMHWMQLPQCKIWIF